MNYNVKYLKTKIDKFEVVRRKKKGEHATFKTYSKGVLENCTELYKVRQWTKGILSASIKYS